MTNTCLAFAAFCRDPESAVSAELQSISRRLMDAVATGGRDVWERHLAPDVAHVDPDGALKDRAAVLDELRPLPEGVSGRIDLTDPALTLSGDTAILTYRALETGQGFGRQQRTAYRVSDVYVRREGHWLLLGSQATRLP